MELALFAEERVVGAIFVDEAGKGGERDGLVLVGEEGLARREVRPALQQNVLKRGKGQGLKAQGGAAV